MKLSGITDIFFDLDHTLWDFDRNSALTFDTIFKKNKINIDLNEFLNQYKTINLQYWKLYRNEKVDKKVLRFGRLNDTFLALNFNVERDIINQLSEDYITYLTDNNYLFDNTIEILDYLSLKYNLHILSNGFEEVQYKKLNRSNIYHYFKTITNAIILVLEAGDCTSRKLSEILPYSDDILSANIRLLLEHNIITITETNTYKLAHI